MPLVPPQPSVPYGVRENMIGSGPLAFFGVSTTVNSWTPSRIGIMTSRRLNVLPTSTRAWAQAAPGTIISGAARITRSSRCDCMCGQSSAEGLGHRLELAALHQGDLGHWLSPLEHRYHLDRGVARIRGERSLERRGQRHLGFSECLALRLCILEIFAPGDLVDRRHLAGHVIEKDLRVAAIFLDEDRQLQLLVLVFVSC